jgi:hypothetical protein
MTFTAPLRMHVGRAQSFVLIAAFFVLKKSQSTTLDARRILGFVFATTIEKSN